MISNTHNNHIDIKLVQSRKTRIETSEKEADLFFKIKPNDSNSVKAIRKIGGFIYFIFAALMSAILWIVALLPG